MAGGLHLMVRADPHHLPVEEGEKEEEGDSMNKKEKKETIIKDTHTGEVLAVAELSEARARAIVKAYLKAGLFVEAVA